MAIGIKNTLAPVKEQVIEAYNNGATLRQIAEVHGVSSGTVRNCLRESSVDLRPRGRRKKGAQRTNDLLHPVDELGNSSNTNMSGTTVDIEVIDDLMIQV
jgi:transposase-like protein